MILTVTLNTAIDKQYIINEMKPQSVMRVLEVMDTAGGKGLNVSRVASLGDEKVCAMGFVGGNAGKHFLSLIDDENIESSFTFADGETRNCINIRDHATGKSTEFLEPGFKVEEQDLQNFINDYKANLKNADIVTINGSMPKGVPTDFYKTLIEIAKEQNIDVILDTSGDALKVSLEAKPWLVKPNTDEIQQILDINVDNLEEIIEAAHKIRAIGPENVAVSLGKDGVLVVTANGVYKGITPDIPVKNTVGCGDSMVAGFAVGKKRGWSMEDTIAYAVAVSTANALSLGTGTYDKKDLEMVTPMIKVEKIK
ncbi:MAG: 1-phosphofructokinase [Clostridia bacterium]